MANVLHILWFSVLFKGLNFVYFEMDKIENNYNAALIKTITFSLVPCGNRTYLNGSVTPVVDIPRFNYTAVLNMRRDNGRVVKLFAATIDGCEFIDSNINKTMNLGNLFFRDLRALATFPKMCPWPKGFEVVVSMFYPDTRKWPIYMPEMKYNVMFIMYTNGKFGYSVTVNGTTLNRRRKKG
ncbi:uncharacterized protein LOC131994367 [Stomoxys calcitrans]|uniref:uncharacterized protein LOC131994367 n=1 Tax=Stomoxys calcitrans TaxID=35570 RepID=UPI0027E29FAB|nr:uncharacterized protein LOC131994367 [Stomoxys calcitrans]